jgi:TRAP-type C4-dicarboxylate transport system permease small subunit
VDFLIDWLPKRGKAALDIFGSILGLGLFVAAGWMTYKHGLSLISSGTETLLLGIPHYPFVLWIAFCCIPMCCVIIIELLSSIDKVLK